MPRQSRRRHEPEKPAHLRPASPTDPLVRYGVLPLRLFLGATFVYAGLQKLTDPGFFNVASPTYIGTQLKAFAAHSPIGFLFQWFALPAPSLAGAGVITAEVLIGVLVLAGVYTRFAAILGAFLNLVLFLSATWEVQPYFLGSDSIYTVAWVTLALAGDQGVWTLRPRIDRWLGQPAQPVAFDPERRAMLLRAGAGLVAFTWLLAILPRGTRSLGSTVTHAPTASPSPLGTPGPSAAPAGSPTPAATAVAGTPIGTMASLQRQGGSLTYQDPASSDPAVVIRLDNGQLVAYDAVCTHAGCTAQYLSQYKVIYCPCHGAAYDPAHNAAVLQGPAPAPLTALKVTVGADGTIYAQS